MSNFFWALTASIYPLGGVVGAPLVRPLVAKFGRRKTLIFVQVGHHLKFIASKLVVNIRTGLRLVLVWSDL